MDLVIPREDVRLLVAHLPSRRVAQLRFWVEVCEAFWAADPRERALVAKRLAEDYAGRILGGLSVKSLYRKARLYRENGWRGLLSAHDLKTTQGTGGGIGANALFLDFWASLVAEHQRVTRPAFDALIAQLRAGAEIPGYGDWRAIWRAEHPGRDLPQTCPYKIGVLLPAGWSLPNLQRHKPNAYGLKALRTGTLAAANLLPGIPRTRAGLRRGQIVEIDDMWHDVKVRYGKGAAERCIELAMLDVATGFRSYLLKPIRRRDDGTRELIMARMMPYLIGYWLIVQGYCAEGALVCGEHGTAKASKALEEAVKDATGGKVRWAAGGLLSKPLAKGLYDGRPRGNFRFKARLEGSHALVHNELSAVPGQVGYTRDNAPEELYGRDAAEKALMKSAEELSAKDPQIWERLRWPYIPFEDYSALVCAAVKRINARTEHALEGWEEQGFTAGSFRLGLSEPWQDLAELNRYPEAMRGAIRAALEKDPRLTRARRLSPAEAWKAREGDVLRAERCYMPQILGTALAMRATCSAKLELKVKDEAIDLSATVVGVVRDEIGTEALLERGHDYLVWINPLEPEVAYVAKVLPNADWRYLGTAPVLMAAHQDDIEGLSRALGLRAKVQAMEQAKLRPIVEARAAEQRADAEHNEALLTAARAPAVQEPTGRGPATNPPAKPPRERVSLRDLY